MSKEIDWSQFYGEGEVICECDQCSAEERFSFEDNNPDFGRVQKQLHEIGWQSLKSNGKWYDFCSEKCRNRFIKENL